MNNLSAKRDFYIAMLAILSIATHLTLRFMPELGVDQNYPLYLALFFGGVPLVIELLIKILRKEFGSDLLAGISIVTGVLLDEHLAATLVVLMLSGGEAIEAYAVKKASSVLDALARRMPAVVHRIKGEMLEEVTLESVEVGDLLDIFPHEICPVDGTVVDGHSIMDESYLTGEPYMMSKTPGAKVLSGAINGEGSLRIRADKRAIDSRYARIMEVMKESEQRRPQLRRLGDTLGAFYTPFAVCIALIAWASSGEAIRFLAVLVVATPCPLLIAIPTAIVGAISLAARRGIIIRDPAILEQISQCQTIIFDKTGTLTYGKPKLVEQHLAKNWEQKKVLQLVSSIERYSKHPLAVAILNELEHEELSLLSATSISERAGEGLKGKIGNYSIQITNREKFIAAHPNVSSLLPTHSGGMECVILINEEYAATYTFRDEPRGDGDLFIKHLGPKHGFLKVMIVSGDQESEVAYLAKRVGITDVYASQSPEQKLKIVEEQRAKAPTIFVGDGINDAPALAAATAGIALGQQSDIIAESADAIVLDSSLERVDDLFHISERMRRIALQSAVGGMAFSIIGMGFASFGYLSPVAGALFQEVIDIVAVLNAVRVAIPPKQLSDF